MAEALAQNVFTSFVQGVINSNLTELASKELGHLLGVRGDISYIIMELNMIKAFLRSAEEKQETDFMTREWVRLIREVALDMEDCIDKFKIYLKSRTNRNLIDWLGSQLHSFRTLRVRYEIAVEIKDLKNRIGHISDCRLRYGITATASGSSNFTSSVAPSFVDHRLDALFVEEAQLVGIDEPRKKLTNLLIGGEQQRRVITVLGMGGLGKTTLTKRVYDDPQIAGGHFDCRAWTTISQSFNLNVLLRDIIRQVSSPDDKMDIEKKPKKDIENMQSKEDLIRRLGELLQKKRYIIVLDDIWNIDAWESIKLALPEHNNQSRVIVTTRIEQVANNCCANNGGAEYVYKLQLLSKDKSMELLQKKVFGRNKLCPENLKQVANDVVVKCGGLPLAIVAMSGVLKSFPNPNDRQQWISLLDNLSSMLETNPSLEGMKQVLLLSYNHLPYLLKPCFLYFSIFPEDHLIKRKNLIQRWVVEGLVRNQNNMSSEVVAEYYFNELVSRSLILPSTVGWDGKVKSCRIHDVMLEVLVFKSMEESMVSIISKQSKTKHKAENVIRRLSLKGESNQSSSFPDDVDLSRVTSLSVYDCKKIPTFLPRFKLLRVLVFEYYSFDLEADEGSFLQILSKLKHLRYLSLKGTHLICSDSTFSKSLSKLQNLVTLDIRGTFIFHLYASVAKLKQLRHLLIDNGSMDLRVLRNLKNLQSLVFLNINSIKMAKELGSLTQLRKLAIRVYSTSPKILNSLLVSLDKLSGSLISLKIYSNTYAQRLNLKINNHPSLLQNLHLGANCKLPNWVSYLSNLAKLTFSVDEEQDAIELEVIKTLPNLLCLNLSGYMVLPIELLFTAGGFQNLRMLKFSHIVNLKSIEFQMECMPVLTKLVIINSQKLTSVINIGFLPCLQEIQLEALPKGIIEVFKSIVEAHKNIPKLTTINMGESKLVKL